MPKKNERLKFTRRHVLGGAAAMTIAMPFINGRAQACMALRGSDVITQHPPRPWACDCKGRRDRPHDG